MSSVFLPSPFVGGVASLIRTMAGTSVCSVASNSAARSSLASLSKLSILVDASLWTMSRTASDKALRRASTSSLMDCTDSAVRYFSSDRSLRSSGVIFLAKCVRTSLTSCFLVAEETLLELPPLFIDEAGEGTVARALACADGTS